MTPALDAQQRTLTAVRLIAQQFQAHGPILSVQEYGHGNVNDTYRVTVDHPTQPYFILQRINTRIFRQPEQVMANLCTFTQHVQHRLSQSPMPNGRRWEVPQVLLTTTGTDHWCEPDGTYWRALSFIDQAQAFDTIQNLAHASEVGFGLGTFHNLISDLPPERLADTLVGFHITPVYLQQYDAVLDKPTVHQTVHPSPEMTFCLDFIESRRSEVGILENAKASGQLPLRLIHGDPKINNVMIDVGRDQAVSLIDLDTVKPGLVHYDIGDCLRSGCNLLGEETEQWELVRFDLDLSQALLQGYLSVARHFLTPNDYDYVFDAIRLIAFELGLRFFTDHLAGDIYFKTQYTGHNLARALVQFKLTESIEVQEKGLRTIINDLR